MKLYCEFRLNHNEISFEDYSFVPSKFHLFYNNLGAEKIKTLSYQESNLKKEMSEKSQKTNIGEVIKDNFVPGRYTNKEIKKKLQVIYDSLGEKRTAKASDLKEYIEVKDIMITSSVTKKREHGFEIVSNPIRKMISLFDRVYYSENPKIYNIDTILHIIKSGSPFYLKQNIEKIQKESNHDSQSDLKRFSLPAVTYNGTFQSKNEKSLNQYSSFTALDFDQFQTEDELQKSRNYFMTQVDYCYSVYRTPSGKGLKVIIQHDNDKPELHWNLFQQLLNKFPFSQSDTSVKDLSRGHFLSYDPHLWINPNPVSFHFVFDPSIAQPIQKEYSSSGKIQEAKSTKDQLFRHQLFNTTHSSMTDERIIGILDSFFHNYPDQYKKGNRHNSIYYQACKLCKAGILIEKAIEYIGKNFTSPQAEIIDCCRHAYSKSVFGIDRKTFTSAYKK